MEYDRLLAALVLVAEFGELPDLKGLDLARLFKDAQQCVPHHRCAVCRIAQAPQADPRLEEHHIAGKVRRQPNLPDTLTVCSRCHSWLSDHQRAWLLCSRDPATGLSSYFFGWADVFDLIAKKSGFFEFEKFAAKFRVQGAHVRNSLRKRKRASSCVLAI